MRLLIDANIVLDVLQKREPYWKDSSVIWKLCETEQAEGYISTLTFANLMYVMRRELDPAQIRDVLDKLRLIFRFADFTAADMEKAAEMGWDDFEDAIQAATAERIIAANPMSTRQIANICKLFNFESNRLEFAKYAYRRCVDPNNYFLIDEVFTFDSSKKELYNYIRNL